MNNPLITTKTCKKCNIQKPLSEFRNQKSTPDGKKNICRDCHDIQVKQYYETNKTRIIARIIKNRKNKNKLISKS